MYLQKMTAWARPRGLTFLEIVFAVAILVVAILPIFVVLNRDVEETDINASEAFAIGKATEVLNTMLDNVPFEFLRQGSPFGVLCSSDIKDKPQYKAQYSDNTVLHLIAKNMFGNDVKAMTGGWECQGVVTDPRGISYQVRVRVEDMPAIGTSRKPQETPAAGLNNPFPPAKDLTFSFLVNPRKLEEPNFTEDYTKAAYPFEGKTPTPPRGKAGQQGVAVAPTEIYDEGDYAKESRRYFQVGCVDPVNYTVADPTLRCCSMKRLTCEVQWNLDKTLFEKPDTVGPKTQRIHLITMKADLDR